MGGVFAVGSCSLVVILVGLFVDCNKKLTKEISVQAGKSLN